MVLNVRLLTPDRILCSAIAEEVILPGLDGQIGILGDHATMVTILDVGLLKLRIEGSWTPFLLSDGIAEIDRNRVTILANNVDEISANIVASAKEDLQKATLDIENATTTKERIDAVQRIKRSSALVEASNFLSK